MMMTVSLERLLVESSKLQDHTQQSCIIHNVKTNVERSKWSLPILGYTDLSDEMVQWDEDTC